MTLPIIRSKSTAQSPKIIFLAAGYALFFLITLWAAYTDHLPLSLLAQIPYYDKFGHVILYCIPSYLGHRLCQQKHFKKRGGFLPVFPALFALFTVTEELIQGFSPHRTLDAGDLVCSFIGIAVGYWLAQLGRSSTKA
jgi:polysaccharide biosynthesis protein VpsQ